MIDQSETKTPADTRLDSIPGSSGLPFIGHAFAFARNPIAFLTGQQKIHGDIFQFKLGSKTVINVSRPEWIHDMLIRDHASFEKTGVLERARPVVGNGLLTSSGETHKRHKRLAQPAFSRTFLHEYGRVMPDVIRGFAENLKNGQRLNLVSAMNRLSLEIVGKTLFGIDFQSDAAALSGHVNALLESFNDSLHPLRRFLMRLPARRKRYAAARAYVDHLVTTMMESGPTEKNQKTMLGLWLESMKKDEAPLNERQIRDEIVTMLIAGHETVASALYWTFYLLGSHAQSQDQVRAEAEAVFGANDPAPEDFDKLSFTDQVIKESFRLFPPIWTLTRRTVKDYRAGEHFIPAGTFVGISQYMVHRDPAYFTNPSVFDPSRWTAEEEAKRPDFSYFPFGGGPRGCIGEGFAVMEMKMVLGMLLKEWEFAVEPNQKIEFKPLVSLKSKNPIYARVTKRRVENRLNVRFEPIANPL